MSQVPSSDGEQTSGPITSRDAATERSADAAENRSELWRVIAADGSSQAAPGQLDEATVARILANKPRRVANLRAAPADGEPGDEVEPLVDFLNDKDVTLLDLDLLSCDLSLLSVEVVPVNKVPPVIVGDSTSNEAVGRTEELTPLPLTTATASLAGDRQLSAVIRAWPRLPEDLRDAIWWIARGGMRRIPQAR